MYQILYLKNMPLIIFNLVLFLVDPVKFMRVICKAISSVASNIFFFKQSY